MRIWRRTSPQRAAGVPVSAQQEALDWVVVTYAGGPVAVVGQHIELAREKVSAAELDEATLASWSEQMSEGFRVIVPSSDG